MSKLPSASRLSLHRAERLVILASIALVTALCWLALVRMAAQMSGMGDMAESGAGMDAAATPGLHAWSGADFALMLVMWVVMMVGMMLPTAVPMTLIYAGIARKASREGTVLAPTGVFVAGYLLAWSAFSLAATLAQLWLDRLGLLSPMMVTSSPALGAGLLVAAGVYQLTPLKSACLRHCRAPAHFFAEHWRPGRIGALRLGWSHGLFCLGCCWLLMGLLFVGGVMNLLWIAAITLFVLLEKVIPRGVGGGRAAGVAMIALGGIALYRLA